MEKFINTQVPREINEMKIMPKTFYSQQGEDIYIYNNFINKICADGIFVELGATDGVVYSNTKFFEDELQMTGVLIEPTKQYNDLIINRPNCKCYNLAVNYTKDKVKFLGDNAVAGILDSMNNEHIKFFHNNSITNTYYVDGAPISDILEMSGIKYIDLFTIDVEGGEDIVLKTMNFNIPIYVICIELDGNNTLKDDSCREILINNNFILIKRMCINEFWINNKYFRKELLYDKDNSKLKFDSSIYELGNFPYLADHLIKEIEESL